MTGYKQWNISVFLLRNAATPHGKSRRASSSTHRFLEQVPATLALRYHSVRPRRLRVAISRDPCAPSGLQRAALVLLVRPGGRAYLDIPLVLQAGVAQLTSFGRVPQRGLAGPALDAFRLAAERHRIFSHVDLRESINTTMNLPNARPTAVPELSCLHARSRVSSAGQSTHAPRHEKSAERRFDDWTRSLRSPANHAASFLVGFHRRTRTRRGHRR